MTSRQGGRPASGWPLAVSTRRPSVRACSVNLVRRTSVRLALQLAGLLACGDGLQEELHRVERPVGLVGGEGLLVRPVVSHGPDLMHEGALRRAQCVAEHIVPLPEHRAEQGGGVPDDVATCVAAHLVTAAALDGSLPVATKASLQLPLDERSEAGPQGFEAPSDPVPVADRHSPILPRSPCSFAVLCRRGSLRRGA